MGFVRAEPTICGIKGRRTIRALLDSGAKRSYIRETLADGSRALDVGYQAYLGKHSTETATTEVVVAEWYSFPKGIVVGRTIEPLDLVLMPKLIEDVIVGTIHLQRMGISLDLPNHRVLLDPKR